MEEEMVNKMHEKVGQLNGCTRKTSPKIKSCLKQFSKNYPPLQVHHENKNYQIE